jgi:hypothetical protein
VYEIILLFTSGLSASAAVGRNTFGTENTALRMLLSEKVVAVQRHLLHIADGYISRENSTSDLYRDVEVRR